MIVPPFLQKNDTIAIVAPSGIIKNEESIYKAVELAKNWGLQVVIGKHVFDQNFHFAGTDKNRLTDLQEALDNPKIKAIWCARGGYGTARIIDALDFSKFESFPKWLIGYSDITVLHNHINNLGIATIHGMMPVNFSLPKQTIEESIISLKKALFGETINYEFPNSKFNKHGVVEGKLVGGNLTLLENSLGTSSSLNTTNNILFIEEIGEYKYHIDRMLWALKRNNVFKNCKGLLIGDMTNIKINDPYFGQSIEEIILTITDEYDFPIAFNFPAGHEDINKAIYFGKHINLSINPNLSSLKFI